LGDEENPIVFEAYNRKQARLSLKLFIETNPMYKNVAIISETLFIPIIGETTKFVDKVEYVWIGNGWIPLWEYKKRENIE
jgi:hypothetical protein